MDVGLSLGISPREPILHNVEVVQQAEALGFDSVWIADVSTVDEGLFYGPHLMRGQYVEDPALDRSGQSDHETSKHHCEHVYRA